MTFPQVDAVGIHRSALRDFNDSGRSAGRVCIRVRGFHGGRAAVRLSPSGAVALAECAAMGVTVQAFLNGSGGLSAPDVIGPGLLGGAAYAIGLLLLCSRDRVWPHRGCRSCLRRGGDTRPLAGDLVLARHIGVAQITGILICCLAVVLLSVTHEALQSGVPPYFSLRLGVLSGIGIWNS